MGEGGPQGPLPVRASTARPRCAEDGTLSGAAGLACSSPGLRRHAELGCAHPRAPSRGPQRVPVPSLASPPPPPRFGTFSYLSNQHSAFLHLGGLKRRQTFSEVKELTSHSCFRERSSGCCGPPALGNLGSLREDVHVPGAPDGGSGSPWRASPGPPCAQACLLPEEEQHDHVQEGVCGVLGYSRDLCLQGQTRRGPWARPSSRSVALSVVRAIGARPPWPRLVISVPAMEGPGRWSVSLVARPSCVLSWWCRKSDVGRTRGGGHRKDSLLLGLPGCSQLFPHPLRGGYTCPCRKYRELQTRKRDLH